MKSKKYVWLAFVALAAFLILIMQVRVADKDNQIGDLRQDNVVLSKEAQNLRDENTDLRFKVTGMNQDTEFLLELQDATADWGECLERWGTQLTQDSPDASVTKTRCDTYLAEMEKMFVEGN